MRKREERWISGVRPVDTGEEKKKRRKELTVDDLSSLDKRGLNVSSGLRTRLQEN